MVVSDYRGRVGGVDFWEHGRRLGAEWSGRQGLLDGQLRVVRSVAGFGMHCDVVAERQWNLDLRGGSCHGIRESDGIPALREGQEAAA